MAGLGTVINAAAVILGALIGLLLKKAIPEYDTFLKTHSNRAKKSERIVVFILKLFVI